MFPSIFITIQKLILLRHIDRWEHVISLYILNNVLSRQIILVYGERKISINLFKSMRFDRKSFDCYRNVHFLFSRTIINHSWADPFDNLVISAHTLFPSLRKKTY